MPIFANDSQSEYGAPLIEGFQDGNSEMSCPQGYEMCNTQCFPEGSSVPPVPKEDMNPNAAQITALEDEIAALKAQSSGPNSGPNSGTNSKLILGCMEPSAKNYNASATKDDGSCEYGKDETSSGLILGCMDYNAKNYNASATEDDGSCVYGNGQVVDTPTNMDTTLTRDIPDTTTNMDTQLTRDTIPEQVSNYEGFQGNNMVDNVVNNLVETQQNLIDINLLLKSLLFACLFYILSHDDTVKMLKQFIGKLSQEHQRFSMMALFAISYYVINMFI